MELESTRSKFKSVKLSSLSPFLDFLLVPYTVLPCSARNLAVALPKPDDAPVIRMTLFKQCDFEQR